MAQVEQKAECVVWNRAVAQLPVLPGSVGDLTAARGGGHTQAQLFAAVAELFGGHKFFRLEVQDATPLRTQRHCKKKLISVSVAVRHCSPYGDYVVIADVSVLRFFVGLVVVPLDSTGVVIWACPNDF